MNQGLRVGLIGESIDTVTEQQTAKAMGSGLLEVYATPAMIALLEAAAVSAIDPYLDDDRASVGIEMNVRHLSATPIGEHITAIAEVTRIDGKRVTLEVRAWDERELIGEGTHVRYLIYADDFMERLNRNDVATDDELT
jgi:predicted thioesterase